MAQYSPFNFNLKLLFQNDSISYIFMYLRPIRRILNFFTKDSIEYFFALIFFLSSYTSF